MAIERKQRGPTGGGDRITEPGEYVVIITKVDLDKPSQKGDPMITITFQTNTGKKINGYYVLKHKWHMEDIDDIKTACGLKKEVATKLLPNLLFGKSIGIAVEAAKPKEDGKIWMEIKGYGKPEQVEQSKADESFGTYGSTAHITDEEVPF